MGIGKGRNHTRELKLSVLERLVGGESVSALGRELGVRRKLIQQWRAAYAAGGADALRGRGRPRRGERAVLPAPSTPVVDAAGPSELELARQRIAALERKIGQQALELDFFVAALQLSEKVGRAASVPSDVPASSASSAAGRSSKAAG